MTRKRAVVTGGARGIGQAVTRLLLSRGVDVIVVARTSDSVNRALEGLASVGGGSPTGFVADVSNPDDVARLGAFVLADGAPTYVVNNAGIVRRGTPVEATPISAWDEVMAVNLRGPFLVTRAFLPAMKAQGGGRFVHIASISSRIACPDNASYAASKWGLIGFARSLAEELRGSTVQSMTVLPGSVDTDMLKGSGFPPQMSAADVAKVVADLLMTAPDSDHGLEHEMFG